MVASRCSRSVCSLGSSFSLVSWSGSLPWLFISSSKARNRWWWCCPSLCGTASHARAPLSCSSHQTCVPPACVLWFASSLFFLSLLYRHCCNHGTELHRPLLCACLGVSCFLLWTVSFWLWRLVWQAFHIRETVHITVFSLGPFGRGAHSVFTVNLTLMWEGNQLLMWSQTLPKPRPLTLP